MTSILWPQLTGPGVCILPKLCQSEPYPGPLQAHVASVETGEGALSLTLYAHLCRIIEVYNIYTSKGTPEFVQWLSIGGILSFKLKTVRQAVFSPVAEIILITFRIWKHISTLTHRGGWYAVRQNQYGERTQNAEQREMVLVIFWGRDS